MNENQTSAIGDGTKDLLVFQLGPVQEFIAQARSTRDLWSGSYLLSWLMASTIAKIMREENIGFDDIVMPAPYIEGEDGDTQFKMPLVEALYDWRAPIHVAKAFIPCLPNVGRVLLPAGHAAIVAPQLREMVLCEFRDKIGKAVFDWLKDKYGADETWRDEWNAQLTAFPSVTYAWNTWKAGEEWKVVYSKVGKMLAARRNTRDFEQWPQPGGRKPKDSLSGKEEVIGTREFWDNLRKTNKLFKTPGHAYGAVNLVKRLWVHVDNGDDANYLASALNFFEKSVWENLSVKSLEEIAKENTKPNNDYVTLLSMDGDHMGDQVSKCNASPAQLSAFSGKLASFQLNKVKPIVERHKGHLVYAGGDDILAILPSSRAIACAREIQGKFRKEVGLDMSCGLAIGHFKAPLQMLVKKSKDMEKVAKDKYERSSIAIALYKRSGEIIEWGCHWNYDDGNGSILDLMEKITDLTDNKGVLSSRFPYALAALLQPYELKDEGQTAKIADIIQAEVRHVLSRQGSDMKDKAREELAEQIDRYLDTTKNHLEDFINLFLTETFLNRFKGEE